MVIPPFLIDIQSAVLTNNNVMDDQVVDTFCAQITEPVKHITADERHPPKRMSNLISDFVLGVTRWQRSKHYGRRNVSETAMQRYKNIIDTMLHSRKFNHQQQEILIRCDILNQFTQLGMPSSFRVA